VADFQTAIPAGLYPAFQTKLRGFVGGSRQQHHEVNIGRREQFAAAVATDGDQGGIGRQIAGQLCQRLVDKSRMPDKVVMGTATGFKAASQL
jgi:hypothetical protein